MSEVDVKPNKYKTTKYLMSLLKFDIDVHEAEVVIDLAKDNPFGLGEGYIIYSPDIKGAVVSTRYDLGLEEEKSENYAWVSPEMIKYIKIKDDVEINPEGSC